MEIIYLKKYIPAEILLLRDGYDAKINDIFKYSLIDLIYKKVIKYELLQHFEVETKFFVCLSKGDNYNFYKSQPFESTIIEVLADKERLFLSDFIKKYLCHFKNAKQIKNQIINYNNLKVVFERSFLDSIINKYTRNEDAFRCYDLILNEISEVEKFISNKTISTETIIETICSINGNILFIDKECNPIIKEIEREIQRQLIRDDDNDIDFYDIDFSFTFLDIILDNHSTIDAFNGGEGGDFGGGGSDGDWDFPDIDLD